MKWKNLKNLLNRRSYTRVFNTIPKHDPQIRMEPQKAPESQSNLEEEEQS